MSHHHHGNSVIINTNSGREGREVPIKCARSAKRKGGKTRGRREEEEVLQSPLPPPHNAHLLPLDWRRRRRPPPEGEGDICEVATGGRSFFLFISHFFKNATRHGGRSRRHRTEMYLQQQKRRSAAIPCLGPCVRFPLPAQR